jgi:flagellar biosynthesis protein
MENKRKMAAAVRFDPTQDKAPRILAKGFGERAERILEKAKENKVPVHENADVAQVLVGLDIGSEIPEQLFEVVASILVYVMSLDDKAKAMKEIKK